MSGTYYTAEALPRPDSPIKLPNLHILLHRKEDGTMAGHCLDFDIWAYSEQPDDKEAIEKVFGRICEMVMFQIISLIKRGALSSMFKNRVADSNEWDRFIQIHSERKVKALQDSIEQFRDQKPAAQKLESDHTEYDFEHLTQENLKKLRHILDHIQTASKEEATVLINTFLNAMPGHYRMRLAS